MTELHYRSATDLAALVATKEVGCLELLDHFLARVERHNPALNAIIWLDPSAARARARAADQALAAGQSWGPLHGLPMTIKESYQLAGSPITWGRPEFANTVTETTALAIQRLIDAGAVIFGKTNVPIHLADWQSYNNIYGTTNNPWDKALSPGGSSGGAAAALAAGLTGLEAGSDIGSSIRNPAHFCGVFGLKPTFGVIPIRGQALPGVFSVPDISVVGPLTRGAEDLDLALDVMAGPDVFDDTCWRLDLPAAPRARLADFRIAVKWDDPCSEVDGAVADCLHRFVDKLVQAGARVVEAEPAVDTRRLHEIYILLLRAATSRRVSDDEVAHWRTVAAALDPADQSYAARMARGQTLPHRDWLGLDNERQQLRFAFEEFFRDTDILLCPAAATAAVPHDHAGQRHERTVLVNGRPVLTTDQLFWAGYSGVVFLPSTVGPAGFTAGGLPVGYQAIAGHGRDRTATQFTRLVAREIQDFEPPPGYD